jgi:hypothetical protein
MLKLPVLSSSTTRMSQSSIGSEMRRAVHMKKPNSVEVAHSQNYERDNTQNCMRQTHNQAN